MKSHTEITSAAFAAGLCKAGLRIVAPDPFDKPRQAGRLARLSVPGFLTEHLRRDVGLPIGDAPDPRPNLMIQPW